MVNSYTSLLHSMSMKGTPYSQSHEAKCNFLILYLCLASRDTFSSQFACHCNHIL